MRKLQFVCTVLLLLIDFYFLAAHHIWDTDWKTAGWSQLSKQTFFFCVLLYEDYTNLLDYIITNNTHNLHFIFLYFRQHLQPN